MSNPSMAPEINDAIDTLVGEFVDCEAKNYCGWKCSNDDGVEYTVIVHKTGMKIPSADCFD